MTVYALGQIAIHDRERYNRYQSRFMDVLKPFKGRLLAADERPSVIEGGWEYQKVILLAFPDEPSFQDWAQSPSYREIAQDRIASTKGVILLVRGIDA